MMVITEIRFLLKDSNDQFGFIIRGKSHPARERPPYRHDIHFFYLILYTTVLIEILFIALELFL